MKHLLAAALAPFLVVATLGGILFLGAWAILFACYKSILSRL
jgi:hypothetical protein